MCSRLYERRPPMKKHRVIHIRYFYHREAFALRVTYTNIHTHIRATGHELNEQMNGHSDSPRVGIGDR